MCSHLQTYGWTSCSRRQKKGRNGKPQKLQSSCRTRAKLRPVQVVHQAANNDHRTPQTWHLALLVLTLNSQQFHSHHHHTHPCRLNFQDHLQDDCNQVYTVQYRIPFCSGVVLHPNVKLFVSFVDNAKMIVVDSKVTFFSPWACREGNMYVNGILVSYPTQGMEIKSELFIIPCPIRELGPCVPVLYCYEYNYEKRFCSQTD